MNELLNDLAERMFESMIMESSDRDLQIAFNSLGEFKQDNLSEYKQIAENPFIERLIALVEEEQAYRNQTVEESLKNFKKSLKKP